METKPLIETNPYLQDRATRERLVEQSVVSSCGVEGVKIDFKKMSNILIPRRGIKRIYKNATLQKKILPNRFSD